MSYLENWFQLGPLPADTLSGHFDMVLVTLSYAVAVLASYVALNLVGRLRAEEDSRIRIYWLAGGAFAMGAGIWSMHFIGMLAFHMSMPMEYAWSWTIASLVMAIFASALALFILQKKHYSFFQFALGGLIIGLAISTMHYMGMEGMKISINIRYLPGLFALSILIGIIAAEAALYLALRSNQGSNRRQFILKIISSLIMGLAICGMHYTGMAAAVFTHSPSSVMNMEMPTEFSANYLAFYIAGITVLIMTLAVTSSISYKKMVVAVENERNFLKAMLDNLEDGIIACDAEGHITVVNHSLQKSVNFTHMESLNEFYDLCQFYTLENRMLERHERPLRIALEGHPVNNMKLAMKVKNHMTRDVIINGQKIINSEGEALGAVAVIHDVTELNSSEKIKHEFVSTVSHELRTPLTSIRGALGILVSGIMGKFPKKAQNLLEIANNNCERLLLLINDILDLEKITAGKIDFQLKKYQLNQIVAESIVANQMYADKYQVSLKLTQSETPIIVYVDSGRLLQVLANLISNACKFSPKDSEVRVTVEQIDGIARVSVSDHGPGIPIQFQARLFQEFSQADSSNTRGKGGTGLGLSISKNIIEQLNGALKFITSPQGSTFYFELPLQEELSSSIAENVAKQKVEQRRLLVCDDDHTQSEYLKALLESVGFTVDIAVTVKEAKAFIKEHQYKALLLDLILPDQDGISFIRDLRANEKTKDLHIIVISVIAKTGQSLLNGDAVLVADWFDKPIDFNKLLTSINRIKVDNNAHLPQILHIEDDKDMQHVVSTLLGHKAIVLTASSLYEAKEMLEKNSYDLIILDLVLPDGNGIDILPLLSQYHSPVLVFSDMQFNEEYSKFISRALMKSTSSNEVLLNTIMNLLN